jgi:serine/threonine-protein kinase
MQAERRPNLPQTIGRYRIVARLGKGAMGVVYSALDEKMERQVAIKVMMADLEEDPETSARFYREARTAGQLAHRNVITIYDMGDDGGRPYIVMELVEGHTLSDYLTHPESKPLEVKVDLMRQIAEGLQAAHSHGIFHRDVKPANLLVRSDGSLKILDFGIARLASSNMTASGLIVGTPDYMSPEQTRGQEVDQRSDIFSAGAVFYFILTGRKPFAAADLRGVLNKVEHDDPLPLRETEAPAALARIVMKALSKPPSGRYQHCSELVADLSQFRRMFDLETRNLAENLRQKFKALETLARERQQLSERLTPGVVVTGGDAIRDELLLRSPSFKDWLAGNLDVEPFTRNIVLELQTELTTVHRGMSADVASLRTAESAIAAGARALEAGDLNSALASFEQAVQAVPECQRAVAEAEQCRRLLAERQSSRDEARALVAEAQKAAQLHQWSAAVALCEQALRLDGHAADAAALRSQAAKALETETRERRKAEQISAEREEALKQARLAETALEANEPERALDLAKRALASDPSLTLARKVQGLATARLKAESEARARAQQATDRLREAKILVAKGKYRKAREMVAAASSLDPQSSEPIRALAEIDALEARAAEEKARARQADQRARAIAPLLEAAKAAEAGGDFTRAAWTAENALAIDPDCAEARRILTQARETIASQPALADDTVDALRGRRDGADPESTVTLAPAGGWRRVLAVLRSLVGGSRSRQAPPAQASQPAQRSGQSGKGA